MKTGQGAFGVLLDFSAGLLCVIAGLYLLQSQTADPDSYLQTIAHGIGIYFIGKGIFVSRSTYLQAKTLRELGGGDD